jgi:hypothetical protein
VSSSRDRLVVWVMQFFLKTRQLARSLNLDGQGPFLCSPSGGSDTRTYMHARIHTHTQARDKKKCMSELCTLPLNLLITRFFQVLKITIWLSNRLELSVLTNSEMLKRRTRYLLPTISHFYHAIRIYTSAVRSVNYSFQK